MKGSRRGRSCSATAAANSPRPSSLLTPGPLRVTPTDPLGCHPSAMVLMVLMVMIIIVMRISIVMITVMAIIVMVIAMQNTVMIKKQMIIII